MKEGCTKNGLKEGTWKDYENGETHYIRFLWTYKNDLKDGPYQALDEKGNIEARGHYKLGSISDTLKIYNLKGELIEYEIWKPTGPGSSMLLSKKYIVTPEHVDGYTETINDTPYVWMHGKRLATKITSSEKSSKILKNISVTVFPTWEGYDSTSIVKKDKIQIRQLSGAWTTTTSVYKDGAYNLPLYYKTPLLLEFKNDGLRRSSKENFTKYVIKENVILVKDQYQMETGIINKISPSELIITWKVNGNYTRTFYHR